VAIAKPVNIADEVSAAGAGFVHEDTVSGTAEALQKWLDLTSSEQVEMSQQAFRLFSQNFDFSSVANILLPLLSAGSGSCLKAYNGESHE
jgi:hypothetical protein